MQLIISLGREFGSGGHAIAEKLAEKFELPLLDSDILKDIALEKNVPQEELEKYDEVPKNKLFSRKVNGYSNSPEEVVANMQFDFIKKKADAGESFVVVGRCAESVLKDNKALVSIFIIGDMDAKAKRISRINDVTVEKAKHMIASTDKKRKEYHNYFCKTKWGDSRGYDITINSSRLGVNGTADILETYIKERTK